MTSISRQVWLPAQFTSFSGLPEGLRYARWDGGSAFPSDPAEVEFYVPPLVQDVDIISRPLGRMTSLRAVQALSSGTDELCARLRRLPGNVKLCNAKGVHARSTAELALALILASLRGIPEFTHAQDLRLWKPEVFPSLHGCSVLIVGYGALGSALEDLVVPFGCAVTRVARTARPSPRGPVHAVSHLPDLIAGADVVVLATELTPATRRLAGADLLARMRDGALLVNVARGAVIDTAALLEEVRGGRIRAALDVTDPEPLPAGHPLWETPGVLITPHIGAFTPTMWPRLEQLIRRQLERFAANEELDNAVAY
ncbi:2-hydroxyacid dehydrogenase [Streptomyces sp. NBC_00038]|uniref:2-hydroxyacid dehydrogenase n=1 Tax=Streptomyces sp. NBC_00038 TaxID=2903615 RepID=UPI002254A63C|nr:2-hydroxyacid dehydrogenase [Streptomyces sp. NBC_00038]MCX5562795.1 2-hydroxyacid dehydrogenase [Streptomyces sp. NBC_00038]